MNQELKTCNSLTISTGGEQTGSVCILFSNKNTNIDALMGCLGIYDVINNSYKRNEALEHEISLTFFNKKGETNNKTIIVSNKVSLRNFARYIVRMTTPS